MLPAKKHQLRLSLAIACVGWTLLVLALHVFSGRYRALEWQARDQLAVFGRKSPIHSDVIFVAIDNASMKLDPLFADERESTPALVLLKAGFPFSRSIYPLIIDKLVKAGAKVVTFDMMFPIARENDEAFREALEQYASQVVIGANLEPRDQGARKGESRFRQALVPPSTSLIASLPGGRMDSRVGFVNFWTEEDEVVRRALYRTTLEDLNDLRVADAYSAPYLSLAARMLEKSGRAELIPDGVGPVMFRYSEEVRTFPLYEMFVPRFWDAPPYNGGELFRGKIVLIGPDGNWSKDELPTPFGSMLGPRVQLSALNAALQKDFLKEPSRTANVGLIVLGGFITWVLGRFLHSPFRRFLLLLLVTAGLYGAAQILFNTSGIFPIVLSPLLALVASGVSFSVAEQVIDRREKARFRRTFERYVSRDVVKELLDNPESTLNTLGGQRKEITVLFSDIRGFTTISESADPHTLVAQLNEYFNEMVRIVFAQHGTLDKFIGDSVMAQWGGIVSKGVRVDAQRALTTAVQMRRALVRLNEDWKKRGMTELNVGIGVNHGPAIVGNLGCEEKMEVSAIGDVVNLASRLEGATKLFHSDLLIGESVAPLVNDAFFLRTAGLIQVKGRVEPVKVFSVLGERVSGSKEPAWLAPYEEGLRLYRARQFQAAIEFFASALELQPGDWLTEKYSRDSEDFCLNPPGPAWDGVLVMTSK